MSIRVAMSTAAGVCFLGRWCLCATTVAGATVAVCRLRRRCSPVEDSHPRLSGRSEGQPGSAVLHWTKHDNREHGGEGSEREADSANRERRTANGHLPHHLRANRGVIRLRERHVVTPLHRFPSIHFRSFARALLIETFRLF